MYNETSILKKFLKTVPIEDYPDSNEESSERPFERSVDNRGSYIRRKRLRRRKKQRNKRSFFDVVEKPSGKCDIL